MKKIIFIIFFIIMCINTNIIYASEGIEVDEIIGEQEEELRNIRLHKTSTKIHKRNIRRYRYKQLI